MSRPPLKPSSSDSELTVLAVILLLLLFLSPLIDIWADLGAPWYTPYIIWAIAIFLSWLLQRHVSTHEI